MSLTKQDLQAIRSIVKEEIDVAMDDSDRRTAAGFAEVHARIDNVDRRIDSLGVRLDKRIDGLEARLDHRIDDLEIRIDNRINDFEKRMDERFDAMELTIDQLCARQDRHDERITTVEVTQDGHRARLKRLEKRTGLILAPAWLAKLPDVRHNKA